MITFSDFQNPDPDTISFTISNASSSFVNALRRTIITDVQTVSFNVDDYTNSDLQVIKNTSSVHNLFFIALDFCLLILREFLNIILLHINLSLM